MRSSTLLLFLTTIAAIFGGYFYGLHWKNRNIHTTQDVPVDVRNQISELELENQSLKDEIVSLRALAESGGDFIAPQKLIEFVETDLRLTFKEQPKIIFALADEEIQKAAIQQYHSSFSEEGMLIRSKILFPSIGIMPPNNVFITQLGIAEGNGARAFYDADRRLTIIPSDYDKEHVNDLSAMVKMLAVNLLDQYYRDESVLSDDTWHARKAIIYGAASFTADRYKFLASKNLDRLPGGNPRALAIADVFNSLPQYIRSLAHFPSIHGKEHIEIWLNTNVDKDFSDLLKTTHSTSQILFKNTDSVDAQANSQSTIDSQKYTVSTRLGAIAILSHYMQSMKYPDALKATEGYLDDRLIYNDVTEDEDATQLSGEVTWTITFSTAEQTAVFAAHLDDLCNGETGTEDDKTSSIIIKGNTVKLSTFITFDTKTYVVTRRLLKN